MSVQIERRQFEQYKRLVKFLGSLMIVLLELALYYYVWMNYYNRNMEVAFWRRGNWLIAGEYLSLLLLLHRMYGGLKIGIYKYWTLVYSHMISLIGVNAFSYVQVVLFDKKMHNPTALLILTIVDFLVVMLWTFAFKKIYAALFPKKTSPCPCGQANVPFNGQDRVQRRQIRDQRNDPSAGQCGENHSKGREL